MSGRPEDDARDGLTRHSRPPQEPAAADTEPDRAATRYTDPVQTPAPNPPADSAQHGSADTLLRRGTPPSGGAGPTPPTAPEFPLVSPEVYDVGDEFARGGLGRIIDGYDRRLHRTVALKELLSRDAQAEGRFLREAMITARLEHPNIVPIHEAGQWPNGARFYAMKLVKGRTLAELLEEANTDEERLALLPAVIDVCEAVAYAHSQGILHRDLKPSNVMLGDFGETVVIDWGLAKDLNDPTDVDLPRGGGGASPEGTFETQDGIVVGTPPYMPPEQAAAQTLDRRSDVYALGAILYHVLTGYRPYQNVKPHKVLQAVVSHPPTPLESLAPDMQRDLLAIVNKAMARDPEQRYETAEKMAEELRRFSTGKLVGAHEYSTYEIVKRYVRRQRGVVLTASLAAFALLALAAWSVENIRKERNQAQTNAEVALTRLDRFRLERARGLLDRDPTAALAQLLRIEELGHVSPGASSLAAEAVDRGVSQHVLREHQDAVDAVAISPDGRTAASVSRDASLWLWDVATGNGRRLPGHEDRVSVVVFSPDGGRLATGSHDRTVRVWRRDGTLEQVLEGHRGPVKGLAFSPDGRRIASASEDATVRLWTIGTDESEEMAVPGAERTVDVAFTPDGTRLVSGGHGTQALVWNLEDGSHRYLQGHAAPIVAIAVAAAGRKVATADSLGALRLFDLDAGVARWLNGHTSGISTLAFSPDGHWLASAGLDRAVRVWDLDGRDHRVLEGHEERVADLAFGADGVTLVSSGWDKTVRVWNVPLEEQRVLLGHDDVVGSVALSQDGRTLVSGGWDREVRLWRVEPPRSRRFDDHTIGVHAVDFSPDGGRLASGGHDDAVRMWDLASGEMTVFRGHTDHVFRVRFSPDGEWIASSSDDQTVRLWSVSGAEDPRVLEGHTADVEELAFSPDGRRLASAGEDDAVWLWDLGTADGQRLEGHEGHVTDVTFTPDGRRVVSSSRDGTVRLWSVVGEGTAIVRGHEGAVFGVAVAPDGSELASAGADGTVRIHDLPGGRYRRQYDIPGARRVRYSPDGRFLAVTTAGETAWLCRRAYAICDELTGHQATVWDLAFDPASHALVTGSADGTVRLWDVETTDSRVLRGHALPVYDVAVSSDGRWVASASADTTVRVWPLTLPPNPDRLFEYVEAQTSWRLDEPD